MSEVLPLHAQLVHAGRLPGGLLFVRLRLTAAPAEVIDAPVHLTLYPTDQVRLLKAWGEPPAAALSLELARALGLPEDWGGE